MTYTKEQIKAKLETEDRWVVRGMLAIYARQTADEKRDGDVKYNNKIGFSGCDSELLSSFSRQVVRWQDANPQNVAVEHALSPRQMVWARRKMLKYAGQLEKVANGL